MATIIGRFGRLLINQDNPDLWGPLISVSLFGANWDPNTASGVNPIVANNLDALVDTGAQNSGIDLSLAQRFHLKESQQGKINLHGTSVPAQGYLFTVYVDEIKKVYMLEGPSQPFRDSGSGFDLILGWDFLRHYTLQISRKAGTVFLQHE